MSAIVLPKEYFGAVFGGNIVAHTLILHNGKVLLLQRARDGRTAKAGEWDLPGGKANVAEAPQAAARRETKEETGLDVEVREPLSIISRMESKVALEPLIIMVFRATLLTPMPGEICLSQEHKAYKWVKARATEPTDEILGLKLASYVPGALEAAATQGFI